MNKNSSQQPNATTARMNELRARRLGIDARHEAIVFMREDCLVCRSEGFAAFARVRLTCGTRSIIATLYHVTSHLIEKAEAGLSEAAWHALGLKDGETIVATHPRPLSSLSRVRAKVFGQRLSEADLREIVRDIVGHRYSDVHLSSFVTACTARSLDRDEMVALTRAMIDVGDHISWDVTPVVDKHSIGGLPGNRTTPIVVPILAACGFTMPKTSSRAITSPAGTADTMEVLAPVDLDLPAMRRVVEREGGCIVWGGAMRLSPADDTIIRIERALDLDSEGQLVASVLSKKIAAGSSHVVIDLPVGPTAKVRSEDAAQTVSHNLQEVAQAFGIAIKIIISDGLQPVGRGIGPALEAHDILAVLQSLPDAPVDLRTRSIALAGALLEMVGATHEGSGVALASEVLTDGRAWRKFQQICEAQGGIRAPPVPIHHRPVPAPRSGRVSSIDNRRLAMAAKLAGAPGAKAAGVEIHVRLGFEVDTGQPLYTVHAETPGELAYALNFVEANEDIFELGER
jgi:thymidine phosphorylase